ncbi:MAG: discoidin domain-containing protein [Myxococcota bacterium]
MACLLVVLGATPGLAASLAYVEASSEFDDGAPATYGYNLVDGNENTRWCNKPSAMASAPEVVFGFAQVVTLKEVAIVAGAIKGGVIDKQRARARQVTLSDGRIEVTLPLRDTAELQTLKLTSPLQARMFVLRVQDTYAGAPGAPTCVAEVQLRGAQAYTGGAIGAQVRALPSPARRLLHAWVDEVSAPERSLVLAVDGTFAYDYSPLIEGKPVKVRGRWRANQRTLTLEVAGKTYALSKVLSAIEAEDTRREQLTLSGDAPHASMNASFVIAPPVLE